MTKNFIDVWDAATFDEELLDILGSKSDLIRDYVTTENQILLSHDLAPQRSYPRPSNPFAAGYYAFTESMIPVMEKRTIRAWHYTRLLDSEVTHLLSEGIEPSTVDTLKAKLDLLVSLNELSRSQADGLYSGSPLHHPSQQGRLNKFWMTSHPIPVDDGGVTYLVTYWGGEVTTMYQEQNHELFQHLSTIGGARVFEIAVPLSLTKHAYSASQAVVATFSRTLGVFPEKATFDLYTTSGLPGDSVLRVHSEGNETFSAIARGYPERYVEVDHWKELGLDE